jgi:hypothetical protein
MAGSTISQRGFFSGSLKGMLQLLRSLLLRRASSLPTEAASDTSAPTSLPELYIARMLEEATPGAGRVKAIQIALAAGWKLHEIDACLEQADIRSATPRPHKI